MLISTLYVMISIFYSILCDGPILYPTSRYRSTFEKYYYKDQQSFLYFDICNAITIWELIFSPFNPRFLAHMYFQFVFYLSSRTQLGYLGKLAFLSSRKSFPCPQTRLDSSVTVSLICIIYPTYNYIINFIINILDYHFHLFMNDSCLVHH